ncbi:MAG: AAA family ATPase [Chloroflexi bacterium]|nr:AAA family ATPase [Chloroflexota bacterium]
MVVGERGATVSAKHFDPEGVLARLTRERPGTAQALADLIRDDPEGARLTERILAHDPSTPKPQRFIVHSAADALKPQPPIDWIVERLFSAGSVAVVFGDGGSKKTYSMLDMSVCVAGGLHWLDFPTTQSAALFVDEESGNRRLSRRIAETLRGHCVNEDSPPPLHYITLSRLNICDPADVAELHNLIAETGARLVVIDSWIATAQGVENENDSVKVQAVFNLLRLVAEDTQTAIVLIDHANKANGYRGSTAKKGAVDMMLLVESKKDSPNVDFSTEKTRDTEPFNFSAVAHFADGRFFLAASEPSGSSRWARHRNTFCATSPNTSGRLSSPSWQGQMFAVMHRRGGRCTRWQSWAG